MPEIKIPDEALKNAIEIVKEPTGNILSEPTKEMGTGIASIVNLVFSPFRYCSQKANYHFAHKLEVYKKELEEKEKSIPEDKRVEPDFHTVSLALDNSKFCITDDDIRHMFVNLITSTMNSDTKNIVHPAHAEVLKQMNSTDARILESFYYESEQPILEIYALFKSGSFKVVHTNFFLPNGKKLLPIEMMSLSITNLARLGIVDITYIQHFTDSALYEEVEKSAASLIEGIPTIDPDFEKFQLKRGKVSLTYFGKEFVSICFSSSFDAQDD